MMEVSMYMVMLFIRNSEEDEMKVIVVGLSDRLELHVAPSSIGNVKDSRVLRWYDG
jgi:hypothetical protein